MGGRKLTIVDVKEYVESNGYKLLSTEYIKPFYITIRCPQNHEYTVKFSSFKNQKQRCPYCYGNVKYELEYVKQEFLKRGYILLEEKYKNNKTPMKYTCLNHKDMGVQAITWNSFIVGQGCRYCGYETVSKKLCGENAYQWKGGITEFKDKLRHEILNEWKLNSLKEYDYKCVITGVNHRDLEIHHLLSLNTILESILQELNFPRRHSYGEYTREEFELIKEKIKDYHKLLNGVPLRRELHILFHKIYGFGNNTPKQFEEFKIRYNNHDFDKMLKEVS